MTENTTTLFESNLQSLPLVQRGKVRDLYAVDGDHLLIVATDRLSAFDVVLPDPIPGKGQVLTAVSLFWFRRMASLLPNHVSTMPLEDAVPDRAERELVRDRAVVARRLRPLPVEAIARGYLIGSGWRDYQRSGSVCGVALPAGMQQAERLPEAIYTPSTKAAVGGHDENVSFEHTVELLGTHIATRIRDVTLEIYRQAAAYAAGRGIIIADTKLEFGLDAQGRLTLIDELLTPDSSRFWPVDSYSPGRSPASFDKQFVRDYLETLDWDKSPPAPRLPPEIIRRTSETYRQAQRRLLDRGA